MPNKGRKKIRKEKKKLINALEQVEPLVYDDENPEHAEYIKRTRDVRGRPTVMTQRVLNKLENAFKIGCSDREACIHAEISLQTLYNYAKRNPDFLEQKEDWKETLLIAARANVAGVIMLQESVSDSWMYLRAKRKGEFAEQKNHVVDAKVIDVRTLEQASEAGVIVEEEEQTDE